MKQVAKWTRENWTITVDFRNDWSGQQNTRTAPVSGQESRVVCDARRRPYAGDQRPAGSSSHNAIDRKPFMLKGSHYSKESQ
jgi:hypothetical protein